MQQSYNYNLSDIAEQIRRQAEDDERFVSSLSAPRQPPAPVYTPEQRIGMIEQRGKELMERHKDRDPKILQAGLDEIREWKEPPNNYPLVEDLERLGTERMKRIAPEKKGDTAYHPWGAAKQSMMDVAKFPSDVISGTGKIGKVYAGQPSFWESFKRTMADVRGVPYEEPAHVAEDKKQTTAMYQAVQDFGDTGTKYYKGLQEKDPDVKAFREASAKEDESILTQALGAAGSLGGAVAVASIPYIGPVLAGAGFFNLNQEESREVSLQKLLEAGVDKPTAEKRAEDISYTVGAINSLLDTIGADRIASAFKPKKKLTNFLVGLLITSQIEGGTEGVQKIVTEVGADWAAKPNDQTTEDFISKTVEKLPQYAKEAKTDYLIGSILGGSGHAAGRGFQKLTQPKKDDNQGMASGTAEIDAQGRVKPDDAGIPPAAALPAAVSSSGTEIKDIGSQRTEDGGQRTEVGRQRTEDGGRRTEGIAQAQDEEAAAMEFLNNIIQPEQREAAQNEGGPERVPLNAILGTEPEAPLSPEIMRRREAQAQGAPEMIPPEFSPTPEAVLPPMPSESAATPVPEAPPLSEDGGRRTEDGGLRTEDGGLRAEDGGQMVIVPVFKSSEDALEFGKKATPEQEEMLQQRRTDAIARAGDFLAAGDVERAIIEGGNAQLDRTALEALQQITKKVEAPSQKELDRKMELARDAKDFRTWLMHSGGINRKDRTFVGEIRDITGKKGMTKGLFPKLFRKNALGVDELTLKAIDDGWLPEGSTEDDFMESFRDNPGMKPAGSEDEKYIDKLIENEQNRLNALEQEANDHEEIQKGDLDGLLGLGYETASAQAQEREANPEEAIDDDGFDWSAGRQVKEQLGLFGPKQDQPFALTPEPLTDREKLAGAQDEARRQGLLPPRTPAVFPNETITSGPAGKQSSLFANGQEQTELDFQPSEPTAEESSRPLQFKKPKSNQPPKGMKAVEVQTLADQLTPVFKGLKVDRVQALKTKNDMPADVLKRVGEGRNEPGNFLARGTYDPKTRTIYLFADAMNGRNDVTEVFIHEAFHDGVFSGLGAKAQTVLLDIYKDHADAIAKATGFRGIDTTTDAGKAEATEEWVVDSMVKDTLPKTVWEKIIRAVKAMLRQAGLPLRYGYRELGLGTKYRENDVRAVIRDAVMGGSAERGEGRAEGEADIRFEMAGQKAATADKGALAKAEKMLAEGKSDQEVWDETGWIKEASGKFAFRINDSGAKLNKKLSSPHLSNNQTTLGDILKHPELYKAYPKIEKTTVILNDRSVSGASYDPQFNIISLSWTLTDLKDNPSTHNELKSTLLHEAQHAIQNIEGFARGGNISEYHTVYSTEQVENAIYLKNNPKAWQNDTAMSNMSDEAKQLAKDKSGQELLNMLKRARMGDNPAESYTKTAGEIYAREAGSQFKGLPGTMEGIPKDQWIVEDGNGTSFSVELPSSKKSAKVSGMAKDKATGNIPATGKPVGPEGGGTKQPSIDDITRAMKKRGVKGDALLDAQDLAQDLLEKNGRIDADGMVTLYHRTNPANADKIVKTQAMVGKEDRLFFGTAPEGQIDGYGDAVVEVVLPLEKLELNDIFSEEAHVTLISGRPGTKIRIKAKEWVAPKPSEDKAPFSEANRLTAMDRKGAMWQAILRENPGVDFEKPITLYRATVGDAIQPNDYVAINKDVAEAHLENLKDRGENGKIISLEANPSDLLMANDATEFVYSPQEKAVGPEGGEINIQADEEVSPTQVIELHEIEDQGKLNRLKASMETDGWQGPPILVVDNGNGKFAFTGSHRVAAARKSDIDIPVKYLDFESVEEWAEENDTSIDDLLSGRDEDRLFALEQIGDKDAIALMRYEIDKDPFESSSPSTKEGQPKPRLSAVPASVAMMTGDQAGKQSAMRRFATHFKEFWKPMSTVPEGDEYLAARYKGMGDAARAMRYIDKIFNKLKAFSDEVKKDLFRFMDGQIDVKLLPEETRVLAEALKEKTTVIGEMLVERGIISQAAFDEHKGSYIKYMYSYHILGDKLGSVTTSTGKLNLSYAKQRKDLTADERAALGLIEDASIAVPVGMGQALTDIAKFDFLETVAANPKWVWEPSMVEVPKAPGSAGKSKVKMGIGKLVEEVQKYKDVMDASPNAEVEARYKALKSALDQAMEATKNVPEDYTQLPTSKTYGPMAGAFVKTPIAKDIMPVMNMYSDKGKVFETLARIEAEGMALFKMGKVALNIPTAFRNVISNVMQNNMRGRPLAMIPGDIVAACRSMKAKDAYYEEAFGRGIFNTNWFATEINNVLDEFRKAEGGSYFKILSAVKNVARYYGKIDDINKHAIFVQMRESGHTVDESTLEAMKWGMDYSLASRSVKHLRRHLVPFLSYQYKIAPLIAESLKKRPWVIGKFLAVPLGMEMLTRWMHDLDDDDWEDLQKQLPTYIKNSESMMILPWKTPEGQWQWMNAEYFFPWGNYLNLFRDMTDRDAGEIYKGLGISNPYLDVARMVASAKRDQPPQHPFYGTPLYNQLDPAPMKAAKVIQFLAFTWLPSMLNPDKGAVGYTIDALKGKRDKWGKKVSPQQAAGRWFGANIVAVSPAQTRAIAAVNIQDLRKELYRIQNDPNKTDEQKTAAEKRYREKLSEIASTGASGAVLPIVKKKGVDPVYNILIKMLEAGASLPGPPGRTYSRHGEKYTLDMDQYDAYLERSSALARPRLDRIMTSPGWDRRPEEWQSERIKKIVAAARKRARSEMRRRMGDRNMQMEGER